MLLEVQLGGETPLLRAALTSRLVVMMLMLLVLTALLEPPALEQDAQLKTLTMLAATARRRAAKRASQIARTPS